MKIQFRLLSTSSSINKHYQLVIVGGGSGGLSMAAKLSRKLGKGKVALIEPQKNHYYQPLWTLVGAGLKSLEESRKDMINLIPRNVDWIQDRVINFEPNCNRVKTSNFTEINYDFIITAVGLKLNFEKIIGFQDAIKTDEVCSNYSHQTVQKTQISLKRFESGNALFTHPNVAVKCPGAPQKVMYLADAHLRKVGQRKNCNIIFNIGLPVIFSAPAYAETLRRIMREKDITANVNHNLIEIKPNSKEAIFEILEPKNKPPEIAIFKYDMLHVTPPMGPPDELKESSLVDLNGFLTIDKETLQHSSYSNIFGIGDCTNLPIPKTAAAVAAQSGILERNLLSLMNGKPLIAKYDGYTSCPLLTSFNRGILAEFNYSFKPQETLPVDQNKERWISYIIKKYLLAPIYWKLMMKGYWEGPAKIKRFLQIFGTWK